MRISVAHDQMSRQISRGVTVPPAMLWVFSRVMRPVPARWKSAFRHICSMCCQVTMPRSAKTVRSWHAGEGGRHGHLPVDDVSARFGDDFLAVMGVQADRDLVAHRAGGDEDGGFAAEDLSGARFEEIDGGVFGVDVVSYLGCGHGGAHRGGGPGHRVAAQVDGCRTASLRGSESAGCSQARGRDGGEGITKFLASRKLHPSRPENARTLRLTQGVRAASRRSGSAVQVIRRSHSRSVRPGSKRLDCGRRRIRRARRGGFTPALRRRPRNQASSSSSSRGSRWTSFQPGDSRKGSSSSVVAKRRAEPERVRSMECASRPRPR